MITQEGGMSLHILGFFETEVKARDYWELKGKIVADKDGYHSYELVKIGFTNSYDTDIPEHDEYGVAEQYPYISCHELRLGNLGIDK